MKRVTACLSTAILSIASQIALAGPSTPPIREIPLSAVLPEALGGTLPFEYGGIAAISAVALIVGAQLIRRKK